ncbi:MAG: hypothetical protein K0R38_2707 [Polyangiaceae bacterium]|nr:hypothetical protein [Polyangiaceae bacterium]
MISRVVLGFAAVAALSAASCGGKETRETFVAFERDFQGFREWPGGPFEEKAAQGQTHYAGEQRYFIAGPEPEGGEAQFPVGTIIVKQARIDARPEGQLFAMVKRGGRYNPEGARGWEWFELAERADHSVAIKWRGVSAPSGEQYGADPHGTCNACHGEAKANDYVKSPALARRRVASR